MQVVVLLETEERVQRRWLVRPDMQGATTIRKVYDEHQELTADLTLTHFLLAIPLDAPASFSTHLVTLSWLLRFEFTTSSSPQVQLCLCFDPVCFLCHDS